MSPSHLNRKNTQTVRYSCNPVYSWPEIRKICVWTFTGKKHSIVTGSCNVRLFDSAHLNRHFRQAFGVSPEKQIAEMHHQGDCWSENWFCNKLAISCALCTIQTALRNSSFVNNNYTLQLQTGKLTKRKMNALQNDIRYDGLLNRIAMQNASTNQRSGQIVANASLVLSCNDIKHGGKK